MLSRYEWQWEATEQHTAVHRPSNGSAVVHTPSKGCCAVQMRRASQALAELNAQQKSVAVGGSSRARYREAQVGAANQCTRRLKADSLVELQDQIAALTEQLDQAQHKA